MNWKLYADEKPEPEPKRQILIRNANDVYTSMWTNIDRDRWLAITHWAEIEGPNPFKLPLEARVSVLEAQVLAICGCADNEQPIPSTPTPLPLDPFEVWWDRVKVSSGCPHKEVARITWNAAMKHKEAK